MGWDFFKIGQFRPYCFRKDYQPQRTFGGKVYCVKGKCELSFSHKENPESLTQSPCLYHGGFEPANLADMLHILRPVR